MSKPYNPRPELVEEVSNLREVIEVWKVPYAWVHRLSCGHEAWRAVLIKEDF